MKSRILTLVHYPQRTFKTRYTGELARKMHAEHQRTKKIGDKIFGPVIIGLFLMSVLLMII